VTVFILFFTRFFNNTCPVKAMWYFPNEICCPPVHFHLNPFSKSSQRNSSPVIVECFFPNNFKAIYVCSPPSPRNILTIHLAGTGYCGRFNDSAILYTCNDFCFSCNTRRISMASDTVFHRCIKCIKLCYRSTIQEFH